MKSKRTGRRAGTGAKNCIRPDMLYLLQRIDKMEGNIYAALDNKDKRLDSIEQEIVGVKKALNIFMWVVKIVTGVGSLIALLFKVFALLGPKAGH